jgi:hypothetical protein
MQNKSKSQAASLRYKEDAAAGVDHFKEMAKKKRMDVGQRSLQDQTLRSIYYAEDPTMASAMRSNKSHLFEKSTVKMEDILDKTVRLQDVLANTTRMSVDRINALRRPDPLVRVPDNKELLSLRSPGHPIGEELIEEHDRLANESVRLTQEKQNLLRDLANRSVDVVPQLANETMLVSQHPIPSSGSQAITRPIKSTACLYQEVKSHSATSTYTAAS